MLSHSSAFAGNADKRSTIINKTRALTTSKELGRLKGRRRSPELLTGILGATQVWIEALRALMEPKGSPLEKRPRFSEAFSFGF